MSGLMQCQATQTQHLCLRLQRGLIFTPHQIKLFNLHGLIEKFFAHYNSIQDSERNLSLIFFFLSVVLSIMHYECKL